jgi:hypothetical protein
MRLPHVLPPGLVLTAATAVLARRPLRRFARYGMGGYAGTVALTSAFQIRRTSVVDALTLPLVYITMHVSWGSGFLWGSIRFGAPVRGVLAALRLHSRRPAAQPAPIAEGAP